MATFTSVPFRREQQQFGGKWTKGVKTIGDAIVKAAKKRTGAVTDVLKNKEVRKKVLKKVGKKAAKQVVKGAVEIGGDLLIDHALGGDLPNAADVRNISKNTAIQLAKNRASGQRITAHMVRSEARQAARRRMSSKPHTRKKNATLAERIRRLQRYAEKKRYKKHFRKNRGLSRRLMSRRIFGTGLRGKKRRKAKKGRRKGTKKRKRKGRKGKRKASSKRKKRSVRRGRAGLKVMNIAARRARHAKMRDVFDM